MKHRFLHTLVIFLLLSGGWAAQAYALDPPPLQLDVCAPGFMPWDYTAKVVSCMQNAITVATATMMNGLSAYLQKTVAAAFVIAVAVFGMRVLAGERHLMARAAGFFLRFAIVATFSYNLGGLGGYVFGIENQLITLVSGGASPWAFIDMMLGKLLGFGPNIVMLQGLVGLIGAALTSGSTGFIFFIAGFMAILKFLMFIFDIVYTYISALIIMGFMLIASTIFVPMGIFYHTERYVKRWMDILIAIMLTPVLLFAFLHLFLILFSPVIADVFDILGAPCANPYDLTSCPPPDLTSFFKLNQPAFSWLMPTDPNFNATLQGIAQSDPNQAVVQNIPPVPTNIDPMLKTAANGSLGTLFNFAGVDFGSSSIQVVQKLTFAFAELWVLASLMKTMMHMIPSVASGIAGVLVNMPLYSGSMQGRLQEAKENFKVGAGSLAGGVLAGELAGGGGKGGGGGKAGGKKTRNGKAGMVREVGGMLGGLAGAFLGK